MGITFAFQHPHRLARLAALIVTCVALAIAGAVVSAEAPALDCSDPEHLAPRGYRVLVNPADHNRDSASLSTAIQNQGIRDLYVIKSGDYSGQIAVGFFGQRANANAQVARLRALGFQAAAVPVPGNAEVDNCPSGPQPSSAPATPPSPNTDPTAPTSSATGCQSAVTRYIVLADPTANASTTTALVKRMKDSGVDDLFVITASNYRGQIAAGIYAQVADAEARVEELSAKGFQVRTEQHAAANSTADCPSG